MTPATLRALDAGIGPPRPAPPITLGTLTDRASLPSALRLAERLGPRLGEAVILLDAGYTPDLPLPPSIRLHARPLAGGFGAQRTVLQRLAHAPWVLQLDTDEDLTEAVIARLGAVIRAAERDGIQALGLPRRNLVDGRLSDHYPDPQYRLCRRTVSYEGQVHERPCLTSRTRQSRLALGLHIEHRLERERVLSRTRTYGAMAADGTTDTARRRDEAALLTPFRP